MLKKCLARQRSLRVQSQEEGLYELTPYSVQLLAIFLAVQVRAEADFFMSLYSRGSGLSDPSSTPLVARNVDQTQPTTAAVFKKKRLVGFDSSNITGIHVRVSRWTC